MLSLRTIAHEALGEPTSDQITLENTFKFLRSEPISVREYLAFADEKGTIPHPFLSKHCTNMHEDAAASDVSREFEASGTSYDVEVQYLKRTGERADIGMIATLAYNRDGKIVAVGARSKNPDFEITSHTPELPETRRERAAAFFSGGISELGDPQSYVALRLSVSLEYSLLIIEPSDLEILSEVPVSATEVRHEEFPLEDIRHGNATVIENLMSLVLFDENELFSRTGGGAYFFLDNRDRAIGPGRDFIWRVDTRAEELSVETFPIDAVRSNDVVQAVSPYWYLDDHYWFATESGTVGIYDAERGQAYTAAVDGDERITNAIAVGPEGAFAVSTSAMYLFRYDEDARVVTRQWRTAYDHGSHIEKCGQVAGGAGTTPTLLGNRFVAICDNAPAMNLCIFDRRTSEKTEEQAFQASDVPPEQSACDNSIVSYKFRVYIGNTYCYETPFQNNPTGGLSAFDVDRETGHIHHRWTKSDINIWSAVPKYSSKQDLLYIYSKVAEGDREMWKIMGVDSAGNVVSAHDVAEPEIITWFEVAGAFDKQVDRYDNGWGPLYIGLDAWGAPSLLLSMIQGLMKVTFLER